MSAALETPGFQDPDFELIRLCKEGGEQAEACFKSLMDRHAAYIERRAAGILGNAADAEDIVQEVFVSVHRFLHRYEPTRPFRHWLSVVTLNACRLELRRRSNRERRHDAFQRERKAQRSEALESDPMLRGWLVQGLAELREPARASILLRFVEGLSYREIAEQQGASIPAVKMRVARGLRDLRDRLESERPKHAPVSNGPHCSDRPPSQIFAA